jgi:hypothetical protein
VPQPKRLLPSSSISPSSSCVSAPSKLLFGRPSPNLFLWTLAIPTLWILHASRMFSEHRKFGLGLDLNQAIFLLNPQCLVSPGRWRLGHGGLSFLDLLAPSTEWDMDRVQFFRHPLSKDPHPSLPCTEPWPPCWLWSTTLTWPAVTVLECQAEFDLSFSAGLALNQTIFPINPSAQCPQGEETEPDWATARGHLRQPLPSLAS